jgi:predicted nucleotidyltransferase component of viral defense system
MGGIDYQKLYELQDKVLAVVFDAEDIFYLTGGTALSRFYQAKRYSDDLDFFTNDSSRFGYAIKNIMADLSQKFRVRYELESRDFVRIWIEESLQVDFVNDRVPRYKEPVTHANGYRIDTVENILSNKLTAIIGRDNPKDVFDLYLIDRYYSMDWSEIIASAQEKSFFATDDLVVRLRSFPRGLLQNIQLIDKDFLGHFDDDFDRLIAKISAA